jgi:glycosyltransferase involved in cell wall biosynthesis
MLSMPQMVLSVYPLSAEYRSRLQKVAGDGVEYVSLGQLRAMPVGKMLSHLRSLKPKRLTISFEDPESVALSPVMKLIAGVTGARELAVTGPDNSFVPFSRGSLVSEFGGLVAATVNSAAAAIATRWDLNAASTPVEIQRKAATHRALYLNANLWFGVKAGGSVGHISGVANALMDSGYALDFATCGGRLMVDERANVLRLTPPSTFGLPSELNYFRFSRMIERELRSWPVGNYDFIYQRLSIANYTGMRLSHRFKVPLIMEYNGSEVWVAQNWGSGLRFASLASRAEENCLNTAHVVVTISDVLRDELMERGIPRERIVSYPNCINPEMFDPARYSVSDRDELRANHGIPPDALLVTFVGTFGPWHGAEVLAGAIKRLSAERPEWVRQNKLHFLFVGDGLRAAECKRVLESDIANRRATFVGLIPQPEAPRYLAASDVLMSPHVPNADGTRFFGSPTKLFEYMAMGKPIVASALDQVAEVLKDSVHARDLASSPSFVRASQVAILTTPGSEEQIIQAIEFLVEQPRWRTTLGANARAEALAKYTWKHHVKSILDRLEAQHY